MKLIKGAKTWWRWWSTWITAAGLLIFNIDTIGALLDAYNAIPHDFTATFSEEARRALGTITLVAGFLARFPRQAKAAAIAERE